MHGIRCTTTQLAEQKTAAKVKKEEAVDAIKVPHILQVELPVALCFLECSGGVGHDMHDNKRQRTDGHHCEVCNIWYKHEHGMASMKQHMLSIVLTFPPHIPPPPQHAQSTGWTAPQKTAPNPPRCPASPHFIATIGCTCHHHFPTGTSLLLHQCGPRLWSIARCRPAPASMDSD